MKCLRDKKTFWYTFNFDNPILDKNLTEKEWDLLDSLFKEINVWTAGGETKAFITSDPLGNHLLYEIERNLAEGNNCCLSAIIFNNEILGIILASERKNLPLQNHELQINMNNVYIDDIVVNPKHQNKGYGGRILSYFIKNLKDITGFENVDGIDSLITESNTESKRIFSKNNFLSLKRKSNDPRQHFYYPLNKRIEGEIIFGDKNTTFGDSGK